MKKSSEKRERCPYEGFGAAASGMPDWHSRSEWDSWMRERVRVALRDEHRRFEYCPGDPPVNLYAHWCVPQENPGAAPAGYVSVCDDDLLLDFITVCIRYAVEPFERVLLGDRFELFPEVDSHLWVVDYLDVRNELDTSCLDFRKLWPTDRLRNSIALVFVQGKSFFMDVPHYGEWEDPDSLPDFRGYDGVERHVLSYGFDTFFYGRQDDEEEYDFKEEPVSVPPPSPTPSYLAQMLAFLAQTKQLPIESRMLRELGEKRDILSLLDVLGPYMDTARANFERGEFPHVSAWSAARSGK